MEEALAEVFLVMGLRQSDHLAHQQCVHLEAHQQFLLAQHWGLRFRPPRQGTWQIGLLRLHMGKLREWLLGYSHLLQLNRQTQMTLLHLAQIRLGA